MFRDLGPLRSISALHVDGVPPARLARWSTNWSWASRAREWDDQSYREADRARLDALREMHRSHQLAGRLAMGKAIAALQRIEASDINAGNAARLLDLGTRLERVTLGVTLAELQGVERGDDLEDPWEVITRELLSGTTAEVRDATSA